jgi:hypothetical protein
VSTKKQTNTTQTNTYNPSSMNAYNAYTKQVGGFTSQWLGPNGTLDPTKTSGFNLGFQNFLNNANALGGRNIRNMTANALATGMNPNSAAFNAQLQRAGRATSGLQSNAFMNAFQNTQSQQNFAAQLGAGYRPLQTGGNTNSTETTSGLGTWLPQVAGAAIGGATAFLNPMKGLSSMTSMGSAPSSGAGLGWGGSSFDGTNPTWR